MAAESVAVYAPDVPADVVRAFYRAVEQRDAAILGALIDRAFHDDAVLLRPPSMGPGTRVESARRLRRMFTEMTVAAAGSGPVGLTLVDVVDGGDRIAARLEFDWQVPGVAEAVPSGAVELWTFVTGRVREIRAFYWDTAALAGPGDLDSAASGAQHDHR